MKRARVPSDQETINPPSVHHPLPVSSEPSLLDAIKSKYGDISMNSDVKSEIMRRCFLTAIVKGMAKLQDLSIEGVKIDCLDEYIDAIKDAKKLKFDVEWLLRHLEKVKEAILEKESAERLVLEREKLIIETTEKEEKLKAINEEKEGIDAELDKLRNESVEQQVKRDAIRRNLKMLLRFET